MTSLVQPFVLFPFHEKLVQLSFLQQLLTARFKTFANIEMSGDHGTSSKIGAIKKLVSRLMYGALNEAECLVATALISR